MPNARSCFSTKATVRPRVAASKAMPTPVMPPPITMTSSAPPSASAVRSAERRAALSAAEWGISTNIRSVRG
ncbi:Uncharacterised protein [Mycobacterium tuberculosis]|uniref:Uncharacterized protein n=1 Tax=Mycobacterium tuberculosis TaxID=1773 RepID=A0A916LBE8_MYCTX|nr:Uncharacterised protein [Mycobacterium tuberculosis]CPA27479.1 Uncharacterised protein [Mycobacterium tuberculosis]